MTCSSGGSVLHNPGDGRGVGPSNHVTTEPE